MIKIFISQPMTGFSDEQIRFNKAIAVSKAMGLLNKWDDELEVIDSYNPNASNDVSPVYYLGESIKKMHDADCVCFAYGWKKSRGCQVEHKVVELYGMNILFEE